MTVSAAMMMIAMMMVSATMIYYVAYSPALEHNTGRNLTHRDSDCELPVFYQV
jgi:hypothetical protein